MIASADAAGTAVVSLVDETGKTITSTTFTPPKLAVIGNAAAIRQYPVQVAAGAAYFADAEGVVRRIGRNGKVSTITTFPVRSAQDELSFAVSPDGSHLLASILSTPPLHVPPPATLGDPVFAEGGHWSLQLFTATPGSSPVSTLQKDLGTTPTPTVVVGWDSNGPLASVNTALGSQNPSSLRFAGDQLIHIGSDGTHLDQVGGTNCLPRDELLDGTVLCQVGTGFPSYEVRRADGGLVWQADNGGQGLFDLRLSPDGRRFTAVLPGVAPPTGGNKIFTSGAPPGGVALGATSGAAQTEAVGWLDPGTVVLAAGLPFYLNVSQGFPLSLVNVDDPGRERPLGITGDFVGVI
ncbi:MAG: hypothetical protein J2P45_23870 [Candidatus Dormibacteraeota bacterium]|nr:hypothetical protein [Candidatus Dormibacteraeota bacterium]